MEVIEETSALVMFLCIQKLTQKKIFLSKLPICLLLLQQSGSWKDNVKDGLKKMGGVISNVHIVIKKLLDATGLSI